MSEKSQQAIEKIVAQFKSGDITPIIQVATIRPPENFPSAAWSFNNLVLLFAQSGTVLAAGFQQWNQWNRHVKKGGRSSFIFRPAPIYKENEDKEKRQVGLRFWPLPVFAVAETVVYDGKEDLLPSFEPRELPPLADVCRAVGIDLQWEPASPKALGYATRDGRKIRVGTEDPSVFFHELGHAVLDRLDKQPESGEVREAVAEITATVLMHMYDLGDRTGNCWMYIKALAKDPFKAIQKSVSYVEQVLVLIEMWEAKHKEEKAA